MKWVFLFETLLTLAIVGAAPQGSRDATILSYKNDIKPEGYEFAFETSDGISRSEKGTLKNRGTEDEALEVVGFYAYKGPDGKDYMVMYLANENGFQLQNNKRPFFQNFRFR